MRITGILIIPKLVTIKLLFVEHAISGALHKVGILEPNSNEHYVAKTLIDA